MRKYKLNAYAMKLIRQMQKEIGKEQTLNLIGKTRNTIYKYRNDLCPVSNPFFGHICRVHHKVFPKKSLQEVFMRGLTCIMEDHMLDRKEKKEEKITEDLNIIL
tara:strand:- start:336 stop:647 length:312 start_codon:yes stop_codon:yes gene_type:complete